MKQSTSKLNRSDQKPTASSQAGEHFRSVKDSATKAEIIATLQFAAQNVPFSCAENIVVCYEEQFTDLSIAKLCYNMTYQDVIFSFTWIRTRLHSDDNQRDSRRAFLFHNTI